MATALAAMVYLLAPWVVEVTMLFQASPSSLRRLLTPTMVSDYIDYNYCYDLELTNTWLTGIRIKCTEGDTGTVSDILYDGITLSSINKYVVPTQV